MGAEWRGQGLEVLARQFEEAGFSGVSIETLRKRSSKKELYEFLISARRR